MPRYSVLNRFLFWDGRSGGFAFGDTRRSFHERPDIGIDQMREVEYRPNESLCQVLVDGEELRDMTSLELMGVEDRMYAANRGAGEPFRHGWKKP
jgi:hypothetical protein